MFCLSSLGGGPIWPSQNHSVALRQAVFADALPSIRRRAEDQGNRAAHCMKITPKKRASHD